MSSLTDVSSPAQTVSDAGPAPANAAEAIAAIRAGLEYLATTDPTELTTAEQAACIRDLADAESVHLAAASRLLSSFDAATGYAAYGQISARPWLRWQTRVTKAAAAATTAWMRRLSAHPAIAAGLAAARLSPSWARAICDWSDLLPEDDRSAADQILVDAAAGCAELSDVRLAWERIRALCARPDTDDGDDRFAQRRLHLQPHFQGNARLDADLTPEAAAALQAVLDSLGKRTGPEDIRTRAQRDHDAFEEVCRRAIASGDLPDRAGQPVQIQLNMSLSQLAGQPEADREVAAWIAAHGIPAPPGADCDASIVPVVTGSINEDVLDQLAAQIRGGRSAAAPECPSAATARLGRDLFIPGDPTSMDVADRLELAERAARHVTVEQAIRVLSGPSGLAAWLRTRQLSGLARLGEPALGYRYRNRHDPAPPAARCSTAGPALSISRLRTTGRRVPCAPLDLQIKGRPDKPGQLCTAVPLPSPGGHPSLGLVADTESRRHHDGDLSRRSAHAS